MTGQRTADSGHCAVDSGYSVTGAQSPSLADRLDELKNVSIEIEQQQQQVLPFSAERSCLLCASVPCCPVTHREV